MIAANSESLPSMPVDSTGALRVDVTSEHKLTADAPVSALAMGEVAAQTTIVQQPRPSELPWTEEHGERFRMVSEDPRIAKLATSLAITTNHPDRDVLFAEICIRIARSDTDVNGGAYIAFAATIGRRLCIDNARARGASTRPPLQFRERVPDVAEARDPYQQIQLRQSLQPLLAKLTGPQRIAVREVYLNDLTEAATAEKLGIPLGTIKSVLFHARKNMRRRAQELGYYSDQL